MRALIHILVLGCLLSHAAPGTDALTLLFPIPASGATDIRRQVRLVCPRRLRRLAGVQSHKSRPSMRAWSFEHPHQARGFGSDCPTHRWTQSGLALRFVDWFLGSCSQVFRLLADTTWVSFCVRSAYESRLTAIGFVCLSHENVCPCFFSRLRIICHT